MDTLVIVIFISIIVIIAGVVGFIRYKKSQDKGIFSKEMKLTKLESTEDTRAYTAIMDYLHAYKINDWKGNGRSANKEERKFVSFEQQGEKFIAYYEDYMINLYCPALATCNKSQLDEYTKLLSVLISDSEVFRYQIVEKENDTYAFSLIAIPDMYQECQKNEQIPEENWNDDMMHYDDVFDNLVTGNQYGDSFFWQGDGVLLPADPEAINISVDICLKLKSAFAEKIKAMDANSIE